MRVTHAKPYLNKMLPQTRVSEEERAELEVIEKRMPLVNPEDIRAILLLLGAQEYWRTLGQAPILDREKLRQVVRLYRTKRALRHRDAPASLAQPA